MLDEVIKGFNQTIKAHADISGKSISGTAGFVEYEKGTQKLVAVSIKIAGNPDILKPGMHGVHIHEKGVCEGDFKSAGGHFDPGPFGYSDPDENHPYHMGDLPNIEITEDGSGTLEAISSRITLSPGPLCIFTEEGASIMIHDKHDPGHSGPHGSGISGGGRLGCGVIQKTAISQNQTTLPFHIS